jgi:carboxypeptidase family protein
MNRPSLLRTENGPDMPKIIRVRRLAALAGAALMLGACAMTPGASAQPGQPRAVTPAAAPRPAVAAARDEHATAPAPEVARHPFRHACSQAGPGHVACMALVRTDVAARMGPMAAGAAPSGYGPADLQSAYALPSTTAGGGQTVAIVDAYDDPNAEADLGAYRAQYGLAPCTTANGCFRKVAQDGSTNYPQPDYGWAEEISLDLDMVSAACPACHILLVEADDDTIQNLGAAVDEAVALGAKYVSNSYAGTEDPTESSWDSSYYNHPGVVITAAAGDSGYGALYPAASPYVTSVGGTTLVADATTARGWDESAWSGTGSGCSAYEPKPAWQVDTGCANRTTADVSAVADPDTGVAVYDTYQSGGWSVFGGTSVATPLIASINALAGAPQPGTYPAQYPYDAFLTGAGGLNDVIAGSNGTCTPAYLCTAQPGYDGPTGLGTPDGVAAFAYHPHGTVTGAVTDSGTGQPVAGAQVAAAPYPSATAVTSGGGGYQLDLPAGKWTLTVSDYGYQAQTVTVTIPADGSLTQNIVLTGIPHQTVTGAVTAGSGQPWPLYAEVSWSDNAGHGGSVFTTPATGRYSLSLLQNASYTLQVTPLYPGYQPATEQVSVGTGPVTQNVALGVDLLACTAIGYHAVLRGSTESFTTTGQPAGWHVANTDLRYPGYADSPGWVFDDPAGRANTTGGSENFAIVDSDYDGPHHYQDTTLTAPAADLTGDTSPVVQFATDLAPAVNSTAAVQLSVDGGRTWTTVWDKTSFPGAPGPQTVVVPLPAAAGKAHVQVLFRYQGQWSDYWEIDDVFIGNRVCATESGGLIVGQVADAATGQGLDGASVTSVADPGEHAATVATPGDDAIGGGLYWLMASGTGAQQFTVAMTGYASRTVTAPVTPGQTTVLNTALTLSP